MQQCWVIIETQRITINQIILRKSCFFEIFLKFKECARIFSTVMQIPNLIIIMQGYFSTRCRLHHYPSYFIFTIFSEIWYQLSVHIYKKISGKPKYFLLHHIIILFLHHIIKGSYFPNSLILCSSFKEQTSSCPFFSATI